MDYLPTPPHLIAYGIYTQHIQTLPTEINHATQKHTYYNFTKEEPCIGLKEECSTDELQSQLANFKTQIVSEGVHPSSYIQLLYMSFLEC